MRPSVASAPSIGTNSTWDTEQHRSAPASCEWSRSKNVPSRAPAVTRAGFGTGPSRPTHWHRGTPGVRRLGRRTPPGNGRRRRSIHGDLCISSRRAGFREPPTRSPLIDTGLFVPLIQTPSRWCGQRSGGRAFCPRRQRRMGPHISGQLRGPGLCSRLISIADGPIDDLYRSASTAREIARAIREACCPLGMGRVTCPPSRDSKRNYSDNSHRH